MALTKFKLINTQGLHGLNYQGDFIAFDQIDDELAEKLVGKTHVLERIGEVPATRVPKVLAAGTASA